MRSYNRIYYAALFILSLIYSFEVPAELHAVSFPIASQEIGRVIRFRPTHDYFEAHEFQYRIKGPHDDGLRIVRDWGQADWNWNTEGYLQGHYHIQIRSRNKSRPREIIDFAYKGIELTEYQPVSSLGIALNPNLSQLLGENVTITSMAKVGEDHISKSSEIDLVYRYYIKEKSGRYQYLSDWVDENVFHFDTAGYTEGRYIIGVEAKHRDTGIETYEYSVLKPYILSNDISITGLELTSMGVSSPQLVGVDIELSAIATTTVDTNVEYQFLVRPIDQINFEVLRGWSPDSVYLWDTKGLSPNTYILQVRTRDRDAAIPSILKDTIGYRLYGFTFENVTDMAGLSHAGESWGGAWGDMNNDNYPDLWLTNHRKTPSLYINSGDGKFVDATEEQVIALNNTDAHGTAWADFDNDGDQDLVQTAGGGMGIRLTTPGHENHLYINTDGYLQNEAVIRGASYAEARGRGASWIDWNKDGLLDLLFTTQNSGADPGNKLFIQQMDGTFMDGNLFIDIPEHQSGWCALPVKVPSRDMYSYLVYDHVYPRDIISDEYSSEEIVIDGTYRYVSDFASNDFNGDGIIDHFLARNYFNRNIYKFNNNRELIFALGTFKKGVDNGISFSASGEVTIYLSVAGQKSNGVYIGETGLNPEQFNFVQQHKDVRFSVTLNPDDQRVWGLKSRSLSPYGVYIGYNPSNDRWTILTNNTSHNSYSTVFGVISNRTISNIEEINFTDPVLVDDIYLLGNEDGEFTRSNYNFPVGSSSVSVASADFDNDMDVDIYTVQSGRIDNKQNIFYLNNGDGTFQILESSMTLAGGSNEGTGDTVISADYDNDGFIDLLVLNGRGEPPFNNGPRELFHNLGNSNNWIEIDLIGTVSNRDGIEAIVYAITPDGKKQIREQNGGIHTKGQNDKRLHFGLGKNDTVNIVIQWPSGIRQSISNIHVNQVIQIEESSD